MREHEFEPVDGLPAALPEGETLLWQGSPRWRSLARHGLHERGLALYFAGLLAWYLWSATGEWGVAGAFSGVVPFVLLAAAAMLTLEVYAWLSGRETRYTITNRRIVIRFGVALPITINIPFAVIRSADLRAHADGTGDLVLTLVPEHKVSYLLLWPNVRPWHLLVAKPMLRTIPDVARAGAILGRALAQANGQAVPVITAPGAPAPHPEPVAA